MKKVLPYISCCLLFFSCKNTLQEQNYPYDWNPYRLDQEKPKGNVKKTISFLLFPIDDPGENPVLKRNFSSLSEYCRDQPFCQYSTNEYDLNGKLTNTTWYYDSTPTSSVTYYYNEQQQLIEDIEITRFEYEEKYDTITTSYTYNQNNLLFTKSIHRNERYVSTTEEMFNEAGDKTEHIYFSVYTSGDTTFTKHKTYSYLYDTNENMIERKSYENNQIVLVEYWTYDHLGRRLNEKRSKYHKPDSIATIKSYTYNAINQLIGQEYRGMKQEYLGGIYYSYDDNGDIVRYTELDKDKEPLIRCWVLYDNHKNHIMYRWIEGGSVQFALERIIEYYQ